MLKEICDKCGVEFEVDHGTQRSTRRISVVITKDVGDSEVLNKDLCAGCEEAMREFLGAKKADEAAEQETADAAPAPCCLEAARAEQEAQVLDRAKPEETEKPEELPEAIKEIERKLADEPVVALRKKVREQFSVFEPVTLAQCFTKCRAIGISVKELASASGVNYLSLVNAKSKGHAGPSITDAFRRFFGIELEDEK